MQRCKQLQAQRCVISACNHLFLGACGRTMRARLPIYPDFVCLVYALYFHQIPGEQRVAGGNRCLLAARFRFKFDSETNT